MIIQKIVKNAVKDKVRSFRPKADDNRKRAVLIVSDNKAPIQAIELAKVADENSLGVFLVLPGDQSKNQLIHGLLEERPDIIILNSLLTDKERVEQVFQVIEGEGFSVDLVLHDVNRGSEKPFLEIDLNEFELDWQQHVLSAFYFGQCAVNAMQPRGRGTIIFKGAMEGVTGRQGWASFGSHKAGIRSLAQAMAREFGPKGIHVAHIATDLESAPEEQISEQSGSNFYWDIYQQHRSTWTQEAILSTQR